MSEHPPTDDPLSRIVHACLAAACGPAIPAPQAWDLFARILDAFDTLQKNDALSLIGGLVDRPELSPITLVLARRATERFGDDGQAWFSYAITLERSLGSDTDGSIYQRMLMALEHAWRLGSLTDPVALRTLARHYIDQQRYDDADTIVSTMLHSHADDAFVHGDLSVIRFAQGRLEEALQSACQALQRVPDNVTLQRNLAHVLDGLNDDRLTLGALQSIAAGFPENYALQLSMLKRYLREGREAEAASMYDDILSKGDSSNAELALAQTEALCWLYRPEEAIDIAWPAYQQDPANADLGVTLSGALWDCGRHEEEMALLFAQHRRMPKHERTQLMLGEAQLRAGDWANGWANMDALWRQPGWLALLTSVGKNLNASLWCGESLAGKTLYVWQELQLGDGIWLARYLPWIAERVRALGGQMIFAGCHSSLRRLFRLFLEKNAVPYLADQSLQPGYHLPMMSCCKAFGITDTTLPGHAYLSVPTPDMQHWRNRLSKDPARLEVGLVWSGNPGHRRNRWRSMPLHALDDLLAIPHARFHSLNPSATADAALLRSKGYDVIDWSADLMDFAVTAALMSALDIVVTVDTSTVHLAGALGVPALLMLDRGNAYLWGNEGLSTTPWYDSVRIFRQARIGDWRNVVQRVKSELLARAAA